MISLKSVLAFNMKAQRHILGITQARLAERVNTSTNYIALIESERNFPSLPMLERIALALEIEPPALFATAAYPCPEFKTSALFQKQILSKVSEAISVSFKQFEGELPENTGPNEGDRHSIV
ncbi:MAG: helix-turn-helix transcriptional regulator [Treponema sp.]|jgi:transcriptional regulator with XRE-family HTH domain|nr:helix-turn-helix transcriptional regulator [Treponema sp.]